MSVEQPQGLPLNTAAWLTTASGMRADARMQRLLRRQSLLLAALPALEASADMGDGCRAILIPASWLNCMSAQLMTPAPLLPPSRHPTQAASGHSTLGGWAVARHTMREQCKEAEQLSPHGFRRRARFRFWRFNTLPICTAAESTGASAGALRLLRLSTHHVCTRVSRLHTLLDHEAFHFSLPFGVEVPISLHSLRHNTFVRGSAGWTLAKPTRLPEHSCHTYRDATSTMSNSITVRSLWLASPIYVIWYHA